MLNVCVSIFLPRSDQAVFQLVLADVFSSLKNDVVTYLHRRKCGAARLSRAGCILQGKRLQ